MRTFQKMNDISPTGNHYKEISKMTGQVFLFIVSIYLVFAVNDVDVIEWLINYVTVSLPPGSIQKSVAQILAMFLTTEIVYVLTYILVRFYYCQKWIHDHKNLWVDGLWLHIHDKKKIRVGVAKIEQSFLTVKVNGHNVAPDPERLDEATWDYLLGGLMDDTARDSVLGYYLSHHGLDEKDGVHNFTIGYSGEGKYPTEMSGSFRDVVKDTAQDISNSVGSIYLYRLTPKTPFYEDIIDKKTGAIRYRALAGIHQKYLDDMERKLGQPFVEETKFGGGFVGKTVNLFKKWHYQSEQKRLKEKLDACRENAYIKKIVSVMKEQNWPQ